MQTKITNCYDSHVHWLATGESVGRLDLNSLKSPHEVHRLNVSPHHYRGDWLVGFGWDQNLWSEGFPSRQILDEVFPEIPVAFTRADGHALWINSIALERVGWLERINNQWRKKGNYNLSGGKVSLSEDGLPDGILIDLAMNPIYAKLPARSASLTRRLLIQGMNKFLCEGITHIRDMSCSSNQWQQAVELEKSGELTLAVEQTFSSEDPNNIDRVLNFADSARNQIREEGLRNLKGTAIKIYYDGALGSEGALLSQNYQNRDHHGLSLLSPKDFEDILEKVWSRNWDLAIHVIGDEAADQVVSKACELWNKGFQGRLHLEHAQMLRDETIAKMKNQPITCHMQPCHWLSDKRWLKQKLGPLDKFLFRWGALEEAGIDFDFGSDSPIEPALVLRNLEALKDSQEQGIQPISKNSFEYYMSYHDNEWTPETYTEFDNSSQAVTKVVFRGREIKVHL